MCRVTAVVEPKADVRSGGENDEWVVLYSLPEVDEKTLRVELRGDVLVLRARGIDSRTGHTFQVRSEEVLSPQPPPCQVCHSYSGEILEVHIVPESRSRRMPAAEEEGV